MPRLAGISTWQLSHLQVLSFMVLILSQVARQGQHLLFLFFPLDTERDLDPPDGQEVKTANLFCLDHGRYSLTVSQCLQGTASGLLKGR